MFVVWTMCCLWMAPIFLFMCLITENDMFTHFSFSLAYNSLEQRTAESNKSDVMHSIFQFKILTESEAGNELMNSNSKVKQILGRAVSFKL